MGVGVGGVKWLREDGDLLYVWGLGSWPLLSSVLFYGVVPSGQRGRCL